MVLLCIVATALTGVGAAPADSSDVTSRNDMSVCESAEGPLADFPDVTQGAHADAIRCMAMLGVMRGMADGNFRPGDRLTRGQMASMITGFISAADSTRDLPTGDVPFEDARRSSHASGIATLYHLGITNGVSATRFAPEEALTRGQLASILYRTTELLGVEFEATYPSAFVDVQSTSLHAGAVDALAARGIVAGASRDSYEPRQTVNRQQAASMLQRSAGLLDHLSLWAPAADAVDSEGVTDITGTQAAGFTVPSGETWEIKGDVRTSANVVVYGTLKMRAGSSLTFTDIDEATFVGPGDVTAPVPADVGLWVFGSGQLDIVGTPKEGWNRSGSHPTWSANDEYIAAPNAPASAHNIYVPTPWQLGEPVPCVSFAGEEYCTEIANLSRDVTIQGTADGHAHVYVRSDQPQTVRYATFRHMGPNGNSAVPDGRYVLHFHMMHEGSRGSIIEGVVVRDSGDYAFVPHDSHGITFRDTVAYNTGNSPYWWDPGHETNDTRYERALSLSPQAARDRGQNLTGFRMGRGTGNACIECVAAGVASGRPSSGFVWANGPPNKWEFRDSVAHNNSNGVYHWRNEPWAGEAVHEHHGFVAYNNDWRGIEQGAYVQQAIWTDTVIFGNRREALQNRASPRQDLAAGVAYLGGTMGGGPSATTGSVITLSSMKSCPAEGRHVEFRDLHLVDWSTTPIHVDKSDCALHGGRFQVQFHDVLVGPEKRDLARSDINVVQMPPGGEIEVFRTDGGHFTIKG